MKGRIPLKHFMRKYTVSGRLIGVWSLLKIIVCYRKSEVSVERIPVSYALEILAERGTNCLACP